MIRVGVLGNIGVGILVLRTLDPTQFKSIDMEPRTPCSIPKVGTLRRFLHFKKKLDDVDVVMFVSPEGWTSMAMKAAQRRGKKTIVFWIGTDVYERLHGKRPMPDEHYIDMHLAIGSRLIKELDDLGVVANPLYASSDLPQEFSPMPSEHAVLVNIPDHRASFYGYETIIRLIMDFPDLKFVVVRSQTPSMYNYPNVDFKGSLSREQMDEVFSEISICIRCPEHDSVGLTVMEAMIKGKEVICNYDIPHTHEVHTYEELRNVLTSIVSHPVELNGKAHDYALHEFGTEKCSKDFSGYLGDLLEMKQETK